MKHFFSMSEAIKKMNLDLENNKKNVNIIDPLISTKVFKKLFFFEAKKYYFNKQKEFDIDNENKLFLNQICRYFSLDKDFKKIHNGELHKGLFISGSNGTGKTSSLEIIQNISRNHNIKKLWFPIIETSKVVLKYNSEKYKDDVIKKYSKGVFLFDDLGAETPGNNMHIYGKEEIFIRILEARYNEFRNKGIKTHITTNLNLSEIKNRYGERVEDRFLEMFNFLELNGKSRR